MYTIESFATEMLSLTIFIVVGDDDDDDGDDRSDCIDNGNCSFAVSV